MKKKLSFLCAFVILICTVAMSGLSAYAAPPSAFSDVSRNKWYYKTVYKAVKKGYFQGTSKTTFSPNAPMTRAMFVQVLANITRNYDAGKYKNKTRYADVDTGQWYSASVEWATDSGLVSGTSSRTFSPNVSITRQDAIVILHRYARMCRNSRAYSGNRENAFLDFSQTGSYAKESMRWAVNIGIINGNQSKRILPAAYATRAEISRILLSADPFLLSKSIVKKPLPVKETGNVTVDSQMYLNKMGFIVTPNGKWGADSIAALIMYQCYKWNDRPVKITGIVNGEVKQALAADYKKGINYWDISDSMVNKKFTGFLKYYNYKYNGKMPADGIPTFLPTQNGGRVKCAPEIGIAWARTYDALIRDKSVSDLKNLLLVMNPNTAYRPYQRQLDYYCNIYKHDLNLAAYPGTSNHGWGYALDFSIKSDSKDMSKTGDATSKRLDRWLSKNAKKFGMIRYKHEVWHYDVIEVRNGTAKAKGTRPSGLCSKCGAPPIEEYEPASYS